MERRSARSYGLWMGDLSPGIHNDITDVPGVMVGHVSLIKGYGPLTPGVGPVRTGLTAIRPHPGNIYREPCRAGIHVINGFGKSLGVPYIQETGVLNSPIFLTNTLSVYDAAQGMLTYLLGENPEIGNDARTPNLVVFECDDSYLNDIRGRHVKPWDGILALHRAGIGPIAQGSVGAGVGMCAFQLKGGIGSASRIVPGPGKEYRIGMLALTNFGRLEDMLINGVPIGLMMKRANQEEMLSHIQGSLILVGMTDAPLSCRHLKMLAARAPLGLGRTGGISRMGSGDFCLMVSNASLEKKDPISDWELDPFFKAVVEITAESIWNSLFYATSMEGRDGHVCKALPTTKVLSWMGLYSP